jgi:hypothetical protein
VRSNTENIKWKKSLAPSIDCNKQIAGMFNAFGFFMQIKRRIRSTCSSGQETQPNKEEPLKVKVGRYLPHRTLYKENPEEKTVPSNESLHALSARCFGKTGTIPRPATTCT